MGVLQPQAKECQELPEGERGHRGFFPREGGPADTLALGLWPPDCERDISVVFKPPSSW